MTDRIRRRGENISPADIEFAASSYPSVIEAVAVGVPSGFVSDEDIKMCVVAEAADAIDPEGLLRWLAARLPHFMVPRYIEVVRELPRTPTGKVRRSELRKQGASPATWDRKAAGIELRQLISEVRDDA
jgi:crotonobetaine/carnitine-CoA ligase